MLLSSTENAIENLGFTLTAILIGKVRKVVELARAALEEDKCVVIGLQSTGEAAQNAFLDEVGMGGAAGDDLSLFGATDTTGDTTVGHM